MEVFRVRSDGAEELLASGLTSEETGDIREWFCYTKPMDRGMKIVARPMPGGDSVFSVVTAGYEPDVPEKRSSELEFTH
jgi:hypothetical protein